MDNETRKEDEKREVTLREIVWATLVFIFADTLFIILVALFVLDKIGAQFVPTNVVHYRVFFQYVWSHGLFLIAVTLGVQLIFGYIFYKAMKLKDWIVVGIVGLFSTALILLIYPDTYLGYNHTEKQKAIVENIITKIESDSKWACAEMQIMPKSIEDYSCLYVALLPILVEKIPQGWTYSGWNTFYHRHYKGEKTGSMDSTALRLIREGVKKILHFSNTSNPHSLHELYMDFLRLEKLQGESDESVEDKMVAKVAETLGISAADENEEPPCIGPGPRNEKGPQDHENMSAQDESGTEVLDLAKANPPCLEKQIDDAAKKMATKVLKKLSTIRTEKPEEFMKMKSDDGKIRILVHDEDAAGEMKRQMPAIKTLVRCFRYHIQDLNGGEAGSALNIVVLEDKYIYDPNAKSDPDCRVVLGLSNASVVLGIKGKRIDRGTLRFRFQGYWHGLNEPIQGLACQEYVTLHESYDEKQFEYLKLPKNYRTSNGPHNPFDTDEQYKMFRFVARKIQCELRKRDDKSSQNGGEAESARKILGPGDAPQDKSSQNAGGPESARKPLGSGDSPQDKSDQNDGGAERLSELPIMVRFFDVEENVRSLYESMEIEENLYQHMVEIGLNVIPPKSDIKKLVDVIEETQNDVYDNEKSSGTGHIPPGWLLVTGVLHKKTRVEGVAELRVRTLSIMEEIRVGEWKETSLKQGSPVAPARAFFKFDTSLSGHPFAFHGIGTRLGHVPSEQGAVLVAGSWPAWMKTGLPLGSVPDPVPGIDVDGVDLQDVLKYVEGVKYEDSRYDYRLPTLQEIQSSLPEIRRTLPEANYVFWCGQQGCGAFNMKNRECDSGSTKLSAAVIVLVRERVGR